MPKVLSMKTAKTIEEQICILKKRNMIIDYEEKAKETLLDIGYYRLGFYSFPFEKSFPALQNRDHLFNPGTSFSDIVELYYFDMDLRNLLSYYLSRIEISFRTYLSYTASILYKTKPLWFVDSECVKHGYISSFNKIYQEIQKSAIIKRHHSKYPSDTFAPSWKTLEFMTFGNIQKLYENLNDSDLRSNIAYRFGCRNEHVFINYLETLRILRNSCAHGSCIYNLKLAKGIKSGPAGIFQSSDRHNLFGALEILKFMIGKVSLNRQNDLTINLSSLINAPRSRTIDSVIEECSGIQIVR